MREIACRVAFAAACIVLVGCGASGALPPTATLPPAPTRLVPTATPTAAATSPPTITPIPPLTATPDLQPTSTLFAGFTVTPRSTAIAVGQPYLFDLSTHCGVNFWVDFDGSFWEATIPVYPGYGIPATPINTAVQRGTMTLLDPDTALFEYQNGRIPFRRLYGTRIVRGLCA